MRKMETRQGEWTVAFTPAQNTVPLPRGAILKRVEAHSEGAGGTTAQTPMYLYLRLQVGSVGQNVNLAEGWSSMDATRTVTGISWEGELPTDSPSGDQVSLVYGGFGSGTTNQVFRVTWSWDDGK